MSNKKEHISIDEQIAKVEEWKHKIESDPQILGQAQRDIYSAAIKAANDNLAKLQTEQKKKL
jgi:hypothetical protein